MAVKKNKTHRGEMKKIKTRWERGRSSNREVLENKTTIRTHSVHTNGEGGQRQIEKG